MDHHGDNRAKRKKSEDSTVIKDVLNLMVETLTLQLQSAPSSHHKDSF